MIQESIDDVRAGHTILKVKIGRSHQWMEHDAGLARDIEIVRGIHDALPGTAIMVDANDGYYWRTPSRFWKASEIRNSTWFEEPFREEEEKNRALKTYLLKERPRTCIADGESMTDIPLLPGSGAEKACLMCGSRMSAAMASPNGAA